MENKKSAPPSAPGTWARREFLTTASRAMGTGLLLLSPGLSLFSAAAAPPLTVQQVTDLVLRAIPGGPIPDTVDTLKAGKPDQKVTGIVATTFATVAVIEKARQLGANFIIAHEPTYYNHLDETDWLDQRQDTGYRHKQQLLQQYGMAVWRLHDYWHAHRPDGILMGFLKAMDWERHYDPANPKVITLPATPLHQVVAQLKERLGIPSVRVVGKPDQPCRSLLLLPGAADGRQQMRLVRQHQPDVFVVGELREWETSEFVRDAQLAGGKTALVVLGHAVSEEPGMAWFGQWLQPQVPGLTVTHVPARSPFTWM